ncbi:MAG: glycosyltransferase [Ignavibacteriaceae bacterium]|nr:glycosyltransferase [Ignavibacteriaceae bacterium]
MQINFVNREELFETVQKNIHPAEIIADIGCGIRPQTFIKAKHHICFEPHQQYIDHFKKSQNTEEKNKYSFINCDWKEAVQKLNDYSVETIFLLDVIEHLEKEDGKKLLKKTISKATKQIVIFTPYGFIEQNHEDEKDAWGLDGGKWQEHKSGWLPEDFGEEWEFYVCKDFHTHNNLNIEYEIPKGAMFAVLNINKQLEFTRPMFTVVIPTYNQAEYLGKALDSVLNQSIPFWEAIIVNDGSSDNTKEVIDKYLSLDKRFRAFHKENGGVASALNLGIENASGEWICWLSSDDWFESDKLEHHYNAIVENPEIKFFISHWFIYLQQTGQKIKPGLWLDIPDKAFQVTRFFLANYVHGNSIAIHKSVFETVGKFDEALRQGQDFDMWLRIAAKYQVKYIDKRTCVTRIHPTQTTNSFVEGGILDSTRSIINFINSASFNQLFPFLDLSNLQHIILALKEIVFISTKQDAFLYRCGFSTALVEKTLDWLTNSAPNLLQDKIYFHLKKIVDEYLSANFSDEIKNILRLFLKRKKHVYKKHNFFLDSKEYVQKLIKDGKQKQAKAVETYLKKIAPHFITSGEIETFHPVLLEFPSNGSYTELNPANVHAWVVEPDSMVENSIQHELKIQCKNCNTNFKLILKYEMKSAAHNEQFICPSCKSGFEFNDKYFSEDFIEFYKNKVTSKLGVNKTDTVTFIIKDASVLGGGTKTMFKYAEWLLELGVKVRVISFSPKPDWVTKKIEYVKINSVNDIKNDSKVYIVFSIFEVPLILNKIPISKVVHLCQGYEGYHFGRNYDELRSDKHILTQLHAIPVKNIVVSKHLFDLFKQKFNRTSYFIPNGVDHQVFSFKNYDENRSKTILFIGNPFHPLKGFSFLSNVVATIQNTTLRFPDLKLQIVMGFKPENHMATIDMMIKELNCKVELYFKLSSSEVAHLIQNASVVVCTSWYEGFSLPILEAMACGTPFITTENMGAESFCIAQHNGFFVKYGDNQHFVKQLLDILYRTIGLTDILENAYKTSLEYSDYNSCKAFINSFEQILEVKFNPEKKEKLLNQFHQKLPYNKFNNTLIKHDNKQVLVSIVIPAHNQLNYTQECINSIKASTSINYEIIIIDNASASETKSYLESLSELDIARVVWNKDNLGFPIAVNQGIQQANGKFILIANNDIVFTKGSIESLIEAAESDSVIGIVGPISNQVSGAQKDSNAVYENIEQMNNYADLVRAKNKKEILPFPRVAFLCTLIKKEVIDKIGGLDERFTPGNYEDDDFCLRAQLAGYKTVIAKDVFIHHYGSKSFKANGEKQYSDILKTNRQKFISKWGADPDEIWTRKKEFNHQHSLYISLDKDEFVKSFERANNYIKDKEYELAQQELNLAVQSYDSAAKSKQLISKEKLLILYANICLVNNDTYAARIYFEEALKLNPSSSDACFGLGQILFNDEFFEAAKTMFEWAVKNNPQNQTAFGALKTVNEILSLPQNHNSLEELEFSSLSNKPANE